MTTTRTTPATIESLIRHLRKFKVQLTPGTKTVRILLTAFEPGEKLVTMHDEFDAANRGFGTAHDGHILLSWDASESEVRAKVQKFLNSPMASDLERAEFCLWGQS